MAVQDLWPLVHDALQTLGDIYGEEMEAAAAQAGLRSPDWVLLLPTQALDPQPVSPERLRIRSPYMSHDLYRSRLESLAAQGYLTSINEGEYRLNEGGRQVTQRIVQRIYARLDTLDPLPHARLKRLADLLRKLVEACLVAPEPPGKWCLSLSRRTDPGERAPLMVKIDQYLTDLSAYRDDSHLSAWQPLDLSGPAWEAFTLLWRIGALSLEELHGKLSWRGHPQETYVAALQELSGRNWLAAETGERFSLALEGRRARQEAEERTDLYFYTPWSCLARPELRELQGLLTRFQEVLR